VLRTLLAAALALALPACGRSEVAQEADRIARAVDLVRDAPNDPVDARRDLLAKLAAEPAKDPAAIAARDACVAAYTPFLEGQTLEAKVRGSLAGSPGEVNLETLAELGQAEAMLEQAKLKMPECDRSLHDLKHKHR
jgi:hypothetical protein